MQSERSALSRQPRLSVVESIKRPIIGSVPTPLVDFPIPMQDLAECREELGRLQCLIDRLGASRSSTGGTGGPAPLSSIQAALLRARGGKEAGR